VGTVRELLARGAAVDTADNRGATPLLIAGQIGHLTLVRELLARGAAVDTADSSGRTPLHGPDLEPARDPLLVGRGGPALGASTGSTDLWVGCSASSSFSRNVCQPSC
jgi:hypothetical protein